jgi:hypothetical protein
MMEQKEGDNNERNGHEESSIYHIDSEESSGDQDESEGEELVVCQDCGSTPC